MMEALNPRARVLLVGLLAAVIAAPLVADRYLMSVLILIFYFTYVGQAWNLMMGYAGQLSLGHALYIGIGAYTVGILSYHGVTSGWAQWPVAIGALPRMTLLTARTTGS